MNHYKEKIDQLKWLKLAGVDYYLDTAHIWHNKTDDVKSQQENGVESELEESPRISSSPESHKEKNFIDHLSELEDKDLSETEEQKNLSMSLCQNKYKKDALPTKVTSSNARDNFLGSTDARSSKHLNDSIKSSNNEVNAIQTKSQSISDSLASMPFSQKSSNSSISISRSLADKASSLDELEELVKNFDGCDLKNLAQNTVFASGSRQASVMLIGEAPGATEDEQGVPFCGESGKLLDKMLLSINLSRDKNVYISNTIFWRPPANRRPTQDEIDICRPFVERHISLLNPKMIILVGATAATSLLGKHDGISNIRKGSFKYNNQYLKEPIHMTAIFHPAYLLRQPMKKKDTWHDLIKIQQYIIEHKISI